MQEGTLIAAVPKALFRPFKCFLTTWALFVPRVLQWVYVLISTQTQRVVRVRITRTFGVPLSFSARRLCTTSMSNTRKLRCKNVLLPRQSLSVPIQCTHCNTNQTKQLCSTVCKLSHGFPHTKGLAFCAWDSGEGCE